MRQNTFLYYLRKSDIIRYLVVLVLFALAWLSFSGILKIIKKPPELLLLYPATGSPGDTINIEGDHLGNSYEDSWIEIAGNRISSSNYLSWTNTRISFTVPNSIEDGLLYIHRQNVKSKPLYFANTKNIPVQSQTNTNLGIPRIVSITNTTTKTGKNRIGDQLSIKGFNFGISKNESKVFFSRYIDSSTPYSTSDAQDTAPIACNDHDFDYEFWSDQEIRIRIPDGAVTGSLYIQTEKGIGEPSPITINFEIGTKKYTDRKTFVLAQNVTFSDIQATEPNMLYVRIPFPVDTPAQRNFTISQSKPEPFMANYKGIILHQLENLKEEQTIVLSHQYVFSGYGIQTTINQNAVKPYTQTDTPFYQKYTTKDNLVPSSDEAIIAKAKEIVQNEKNPYLKAKKIFTWLVQTIDYKKVEKRDSSSINALETKQGDAYDITILFCALARASGIPTEPLAGLLIDYSRNATNHFWAEFWIEGLGWIPVDPALAAGFNQENKEERDKDPSLYFGTVDGNRIIFSRGWNDQKPMTSKNRTVYRPRSFAFQPIWEESSDTIKSYTSFWESPKITGIY